MMSVEEYPPFFNGIGAKMLSKKLSVPYMLEIHHVVGYPNAGSFREVIARWMMRWLFRFDATRASVVRVVNEHQTPEFLVHAGVPKEKIRYVSSLYIDLDVFKHIETEKKFDVLFVGRRAVNKGISLFEAVVEKLKAKNQNLKALVVDGWAKDPHQLAELYRESKVFLMPSYNEGGPRVVVEAMACGVPVVATPVGIVPDLAEEGGLVMVERWDAWVLADAVKSLLENPQRYREVQARGLEIASRFDKTKSIQNYAEAIKTLIKK